MSGVVIVGSGLAGYNLVREIRRADTKLPITLVTADSGESYSKPMFAGAITRKQNPEALVLASMESQAKYLGIKIHPRTAVEEILLESKQLLCSRRIKLEYGRLVLATGASPLRPPMQGNATGQAMEMNSLEDFRRWYEAVSMLPQGTSVLVLGVGPTALEFSCELLTMGLQPHVVAPDPWLLHGLVPKCIGDEVFGGLTQCGLEIHLGKTVVRMDSLGKSAAAGVRYGITLSDGATLEVGGVLIAVGQEPNVELAEQAGIATRKGILVDRSLRTSVSDVFALGDAAEIDGLYLPYVAPLISSTKVLAENLLGRPSILHLPPLMVQVKSILHPVVFCPPWHPTGKGEWEYEMDSRGAAAYLRNESGLLVGFALTRERIQERFALLASMPALWE
jgi:rubredoxin---NAD+ reductase